MGSANINQRSMDGSRDTEIAMGAFQEGYTLRNASSQDTALPCGDVSCFRRTLWREHMTNGGPLPPEALDPSSEACARWVSKQGNAGWAMFSANSVMPMPCHIMTYPLAVAPNGSVGPLPGCEEFPDTGGRVAGTKSTTLPGALTS